MKLALTLVLTSLCLALEAQETVIWGSEVIDISSEYSPLEYSAMQALHKPNVLPSGGDNPNAWRPKRDNSEDFVMVAFDAPIKAKQVAIAESENPGAVAKVFAYDEEYNAHLLFELTPRPIPLESRLLNLFFEETPYEIHAIRVEIDGKSVPGYNAIDAIGISASNIPINVLIDLAAGVNPSVTVDKLGANINSEYVEHSPIISPDGKRLFFGRKFHPDNVGGVNDTEDIWMSELDETTGEWKPAVNLGPPLNTEGPNFVSSVTVTNGEEVLILGNRYGKKGKMYAGVSMSKRNGDGFTPPVSLEIQNEYNYSPKTDFALSPDGETLILSAERDQTYGGRDLYVSFKRGSVWSEPRNLGQTVNSAGEESAPFLSQDGKTLYYSTNGISGYGGKDIFVTLRLDGSWQKWSTPENLGSGLNTSEDDQYFSVPSSGKQIYFSRGTTDEDTDIFRFQAEDLFIDEEKSPYLASIGHLVRPNEEAKPIPPSEILMAIQGKVVDNLGNPVPNVQVNVERLPDGIRIGSVTTREDGSYRFTVRGGARYGVSVDKPGFLSRNENFDLNAVTKADTLFKEVILTKIEAGAEVVLNNIFFDFDKASLKTSSYAELSRILKYLQKGDIKKIEIAGHTDSMGSNEYNQTLSQRRAQAVLAYFKDNGIEEAQIIARGYGEEKPKVPNDTEENRGINRRVEFKIIE